MNNILPHSQNKDMFTLGHHAVCIADQGGVSHNAITLPVSHTYS